MIRRRITVRSRHWYGTGGSRKGTDKNKDLWGDDRICKCRICGCSIYYHSSAQGHYPDQLIGCENGNPFSACSCSGVRDQSEKIGIFGPFGGAHLSAAAAMNQDGNDSEEWSGYSSKRFRRAVICSDRWISRRVDGKMKKSSFPKSRLHGTHSVGGNP